MTLIAAFIEYLLIGVSNNVALKSTHVLVLAVITLNVEMVLFGLVIVLV